MNSKFSLALDFYTHASTINIMFVEKTPELSRGQCLGYSVHPSKVINGRYKQRRGQHILSRQKMYKKPTCKHLAKFILYTYSCAAGFALLNLPKGKSLGRSKPETNSSNEQAH